MQAPIIREPVVERFPVQSVQRMPDMPSTYAMPARVVSESNILNRQPTRPVATFGQSSTVMGSPLYGEVGQSQQAVKIDFVEKVNVVENNKLKLSGSQIVLCGLSIGNQRLAFGFKDDTIQIVSSEGQTLATLK